MAQRYAGLRCVSRRKIEWLLIREDGSHYEHPHWFELAKEKCAQVYKTTGTPCSCWMCRGMEYDRKEYKKETLQIIRESMEYKK